MVYRANIGVGAGVAMEATKGSYSFTGPVARHGCWKARVRVRIGVRVRVRVKRHQSSHKPNHPHNP